MFSAAVYTEETRKYEHAWVTVVSSDNINGNMSDLSDTTSNKQTSISVKITACANAYIALSKYIGCSSQTLDQSLRLMLKCFSFSIVFLF